MVQTRSAAKRVESRQIHNNDSPAVELSLGPDVPSKNRQRTDRGGSSKKRRRGRPGELCQLNLDVLFLIAGYVHPLDLLNLARTCKSLRELLMGRSSTFIWKRSRQQVDGLPDCPPDLTEPEFANLVFHARCHGCGKYVPTVLWKMRRRYCPSCRVSRLLPRNECDEVIRNNYVIAVECLTIEKEATYWVDKEQMNSFMQEYSRCSDKPQFLTDKRNRYSSIVHHVLQCKTWERHLALQRRIALESRRKEREKDIFQRLEQHGYQREVAFGRYEIRSSHKSIFQPSRPLTDNEWSRMWPGLFKTMDSLRFRRLDCNVYQPRRNLLASEYDNYVAYPSSNTSTFDLLPDKNDLFRFSPFQEIIRAPEESQIIAKSFEPAFAELPMLVDKWRKDVDTELEDSVKIPPHLSRDNPSGSATPFQVATDKLRLACAVFKTDFIFAYPDVLHAMHSHLNREKDDPERIPSLQNRFNIAFLEDAPYIIYACGLDPHVATAEDVDRRNARVRCLSCRIPHARTWRSALFHACVSHLYSTLQPPSLRWESIGDEHIDAIQTAELSIEKESFKGRSRCLLCLPRVGDAKMHNETVRHLFDRHGMTNGDIEQGIHYAKLGMCEDRSVRMVRVEEGGKKVVKFVP